MTLTIIFLGGKRFESELVGSLNHFINCVLDQHVISSITYIIIDQSQLDQIQSSDSYHHIKHDIYQWTWTIMAGS